MRGLEPPHLAMPEPKSGASTSSATSATACSVARAHQDAKALFPRMANLILAPCFCDAWVRDLAESRRPQNFRSAREPSRRRAVTLMSVAQVAAGQPARAHAPPDCRRAGPLPHQDPAVFKPGREQRTAAAEQPASARAGLRRSAPGPKPRAASAWIQAPAQAASKLSIP
jgi:hypothetical protein